MFRASGHTVAFRVLLRFMRKGHGRRKAGIPQEEPLPRFRSGRQADRRENRAVPALYAAAGSLHRGIAHPCDGGTRHRPSVHPMRRPFRPSSTRDYVTKENKALRPTPLGEGVTGLLVDEFKSVADYEFTANMEHELDEVEAGKLNYIQLLHNFYDGFEAALKQAEIDLEGKRIKIQDEVTDVICEKPGRNMVIKSGRFGKFLACPGFPGAPTPSLSPRDTGAACPVCGAKVVKKSPHAAMCTTRATPIRPASS